MTKIDMKYTSLLWKLGYIEKRTDQYFKVYPGQYHINVEAETQEIWYGPNSEAKVGVPTHLKEHKDFVVLECTDRLLKKGYARASFWVIGNATNQIMPDLVVRDNRGKGLYAIECKRWGEELEDELVQFKQGRGILFTYLKKQGDARYLCLYTSRLDGGLLEFKNAIISASDVKKNLKIYHSGIFEEGIQPYKPVLSISEEEYRLKLQKIEKDLAKIGDIQDFQIFEGILVKYLGRSKHVAIPRIISHIGTGAFWNCASMVSVEIPDGVLSIGGDAFYKCNNLEKVSLPPSVSKIGNNPFAGCPALTLTNASPNFILEDGVLYDQTKMNLIHYSINKSASSFNIPEGVQVIGKHSFYDCDQLRQIVLPSTTISIENNAFAGCNHLTLINKSPNFILENGVLYNREKTQLISVLDHALEHLVIPSSVKMIGKNSFWNCASLRHVVIPESVTRIGYNPFGGCNALVIENHSPQYVLEQGILYDKEKTELIYCPNTCVKGSIIIPVSVTSIGRNSFSLCLNLEKIDIPFNVTSIGRGAFSGCANLSYVQIPKTVKTIGEWAFSYCVKLSTVELSKQTKFEYNSFSRECQIKIS